LPNEVNELDYIELRLVNDSSLEFVIVMAISKLLKCHSEA